MAKGKISSNSSGYRHTSGHSSSGNKTSGQRSRGYRATTCCCCWWWFDCNPNDCCSGVHGSSGHRSGGKSSGGNRSGGIDPDRDFAPDPDDDIE